VKKLSYDAEVSIAVKRFCQAVFQTSKSNSPVNGLRKCTLHVFFKEGVKAVDILTISALARGCRELRIAEDTAVGTAGSWLDTTIARYNSIANKSNKKKKEGRKQ
jgi:hypothetical protein